VFNISKKEGARAYLLLLHCSPCLILSSSCDGGMHNGTGDSNGEKLNGGSECKWEGGRWVGWWKGGG